MKNDWYSTKPIIACYNGFQLTKESCKFENLVFFDTETTGLDPMGDTEILQCAVYHVEGSIWKEYYVKPLWTQKQPLLDYFSQPHGDLDPNAHCRLIEMAYSNGYSVKEFAEMLANDLHGKVAVAHNGISYDANLVNKLFTMFNLNVQWACLDTMTLVYHAHIYEGLYNYRLKTIGNFLNIPNMKAHNAMGDTGQMVEIYKTVVNDIGGFDKLWELVTSNRVETYFANRTVKLDYNDKGNVVEVEFYKSPLFIYLVKNEIINHKNISPYLYYEIKTNTELFDLMQDNFVDISNFDLSEENVVSILNKESSRNTTGDIKK